ncbi:hypothetical protein DSL72_002248 [Monilinia vaccinii-corymbosi]|uniref:Uncharacterized protein n=1 Tax=Monilinia vaccinii-corymbosi TaxID=61207 RepID=A0A8A3PC51_9HELO|nr:hypothetical protein DSL72_002248 [Monilinia vaccinii-corymbosi]
MSTTLLTKFACGHEESSSTRIGTEREPGLGGIIRRMGSKKRPGVVTADSAQLCSECRKDPPSTQGVIKSGKPTKSHISSRETDKKEPREGHTHPLRPNLISRLSESQELEDDANPYANNFAVVPQYGAHDFTRRYPDDGVKEVPYTREPIPNSFSTPIRTGSSPEVVGNQAR